MATREAWEICTYSRSLSNRRPWHHTYMSNPMAASWLTRLSSMLLSQLALAKPCSLWLMWLLEQSLRLPTSSLRQQDEQRQHSSLHPPALLTLSTSNPFIFIPRARGLAYSALFGSHRASPSSHVQHCLALDHAGTRNDRSPRAFQRCVAHAQHMSTRMSASMSAHMSMHTSIRMCIRMCVHMSRVYTHG